MYDLANIRVCSPIKKNSFQYGRKGFVYFAEARYATRLALLGSRAMTPCVRGENLNGERTGVVQPTGYNCIRVARKHVRGKGNSLIPAYLQAANPAPSELFTQPNPLKKKVNVLISVPDR